jgi:hypothetical protein
MLSLTRKELLKRRGATLCRQRKAVGATADQIAFLAGVDTKKLKSAELGRAQLSEHERKAIELILLQLLEERLRTVGRAMENCQRGRAERSTGVTAKSDLQEVGT